MSVWYWPAYDQIAIYDPKEELEPDASCGWYIMSPDSLIGWVYIGEF